MIIEEPGAAFGKPVSHIEAVAGGQKLNGQAALAVRTNFDMRRRQVARTIGALTVGMDRRELWGADRRLWATERGLPEHKFNPSFQIASGRPASGAIGSLFGGDGLPVPDRGPFDLGPLRRSSLPCALGVDLVA